MSPWIPIAMRCGTFCKDTFVLIGGMRPYSDTLNFMLEVVLRYQKNLELIGNLPKIAKNCCIVGQ